MIDSFPFDEWNEDITAFWTFWSEDKTGTYILTVLGIIVMIAAFVYWTWLENRKLAAQAALSRTAIHWGVISCCRLVEGRGAPLEPVTSHESRITTGQSACRGV